MKQDADGYIGGVHITHRPSQFGTGKWESIRSLIAYKKKTRKRRQMAQASRARNRR